MYSIETDRLLLRPFRPQDARVFADCIYGDPDVTRFLPSSEYAPYERARRTIERLNGYWKQVGYGPWAVINKADAKFIGRVGLKPLSKQDEAELIYAIAKSEWGQGLATEAAQASVHFGFEVQKVDTIIALAVPENTASQRIMVKLGMAFRDMTDTYYPGEPPLMCYVLDRGNWPTYSGLFKIKPYKNR